MSEGPAVGEGPGLVSPTCVTGLLEIHCAAHAVAPHVKVEAHLRRTHMDMVRRLRLVVAGHKRHGKIAVALVREPSQTAELCQWALSTRNHGKSAVAVALV